MPSDPVPVHNLADMRPVINPFPGIYPTTTTPKLTALWVRFEQDMMDNFGNPDLDNDRYGSAITNYYAGVYGAAFSYDGEYDWVNGAVTAGATYSGVPGGTRATDMHDMYMRNGCRFFTETAYQDTARGSPTTASTLPPAQGLTAAQPDSGMIRVTAPPDRGVPVNISYTGDWSVGAQRYPAFSTAIRTQHALMYITTNHLYRSKFQPTGSTLDWKSATHHAVYSTKQVEWHKIQMTGETTLHAGTGYDGAGRPTEQFSCNVWDAVDPGETVYYWLARSISCSKYWFPDASDMRPYNGVAIGTNPGWVPPYNQQFDPTVAYNGVTQNTASYTYPQLHGQGSVNPTIIDAVYPYELFSLTRRSHCFQVVTF